jgi:hypothetical protein
MSAETPAPSAAEVEALAAAFFYVTEGYSIEDVLAIGNDPHRVDWSDHPSDVEQAALMRGHALAALPFIEALLAQEHARHAAEVQAARAEAPSAAEVEALAAMCKDAFYSARDAGRTMHQAAADAARKILALGYVSPARHAAEVQAARAAVRLTDKQVDQLVVLTNSIANEEPYALDTLVGTVETWISEAKA